MWNPIVEGVGVINMKIFILLVVCAFQHEKEQVVLPEVAAFKSPTACIKASNVVAQDPEFTKVCTQLLSVCREKDLN